MHARKPEKIIKSELPLCVCTRCHSIKENVYTLEEQIALITSQVEVPFLLDSHIILWIFSNVENIAGKGIFRSPCTTLDRLGLEISDLQICITR